MPALIVLCAVLLIDGWFYLSAYDYRMLSTHAITALAFISNMKFWREAGYFDAASHEKLLLHTWSLCVEWQFYILFPLVLVVLWKLLPNRRFIGLMLVAGFLLSLAISVVMTPRTPGAAFYLLPTRAWEMLAGGLVFFYGHQLRLTPVMARLLELAGFALIIASILLFDGNTLWPGHLALVPVVGSVLVLLAARQSSLFTAPAVSQWLGKTSYSLYLWHWPLSVALVYLEVQNSAMAIAVALVLTLMLGWLSWRWVEEPARTGLVRFKKLPQIAVVAGLVLLVAVPAFAIRLQNGVHGRIDPEIVAIFAEAKNKNPRMQECHVALDTPVPECRYGGEELGAIVIGDSHAASVVRSVEKAMGDESRHVLDWTLNSCPTIFDIKDLEHGDRYKCGEFVRSLHDKSKTLNADVPIILVSRISAYLEGPNEHDRKAEAERPRAYITNPSVNRTPEFYKEVQVGIVDTACAFAKHRPVYMLRPIPELKLDVPRSMGRALQIGQDIRVSVSVEEYEERNRIAWEAQDRAAAECGVKLLDPRPYLCNNGRCWGDVDGIPVYYDDDHLSEHGGQLLIPLFRQMFDQPAQAD